MHLTSRFPADARKAARATKLIGFGAPGSSTADYVRQAGALANCGPAAAGNLASPQRIVAAEEACQIREAAAAIAEPGLAVGAAVAARAQR